jgi:malate dehydrogenase (oxaloacetate-decarboxylating)(NADP+)
MSEITKEKALEYHKNGKIGIDLTKPCSSQHELSLAYTPGVAIPCLEIAKDEDLSFDYTNRGNLVAVISDGTAVLGLGDIGPLASKPVMEGKSVLFKKFANVDAFDIELDVHSVEEIVATCKAIAPTFGGINLEDISAPRCFEIERILQEELDIPVFHDDQHGTAIITTAGLMNVLELTGKKVEEIKIVINGAGAAGISCAKMYQALGVRHIIMCDSKGVINTNRTDLNKYKMPFAVETSATRLYEAIEGADMFLGLSVAGALTQEMVARMAPELGFPFIFRGALDVRAKKITEGMKMAAAKALAALAKEPVPYYVKAAYHNDNIEYGKEHIIPLPFNKEALIWVASAVARTAFEEGLARVESYDDAAYKEKLRCIIYGCPEEE